MSASANRASTNRASTNRASTNRASGLPPKAGRVDPHRANAERARAARARSAAKSRVGVRPAVRTAAEVAKMRRAGRVVAEMHEAIRAAARPGVRTDQLDRVGRRVLEARGATSSFLDYHGYPAVICASPNDVVVHGIPSDFVLEDGDLLSIDCGAIVEGYHGDAAFTMIVGKGDGVAPRARELVGVTEAAMWAGIAEMVEGRRLHDIGRAVQQVAESAGMSVVREYVGHAIGTAMHEDPAVPNFWPGRPGPRLRVGNVLAVEPMVNLGTEETELWDDGWTVLTADGCPSAHFEHTVAVTEDGPEVLTCL